MNEHPGDSEDLYMRGLREVYGAKTETPARCPDSVGPYRILREIGSGGMGVVYEAEQQAPRRRVAIKIIRGGRFVGQDSVRMFQREAHALGLLDHPGIASIHEAGVTEDGVHYLAMEYVDGISLSEWCSSDSPRTGLPAKLLRLRLEVFAQICHAVTFAHQRGVVHRDLKPGNISITGTDSEPVVKVLDFGLARILDRDATFFTESARIQGTLAYMSPEQVDGTSQQADVRGDVYALGVVLFEMLTGKLPLELPETSLAAAARVATETPPQTLQSAWPGPRRASRDLSTVVSKALEKRPDDRYQSVSELADDLARFVAGQPVSARSPSPLEQARRFVARNTIACVAVVAALFVLSGFTIALSNQVEEARAQRDRANAETASAESVIAFLSDMYRASSPEMAGGETVTVRTFLDRTARRIDSSLQSQPAIRARIMTLIGCIYRDLGLDDTAHRQLDAAVRIRKQLGEPSALADAMVELAVLDIHRNRFDDARVLLREALATAVQAGDTLAQSRALRASSDCNAILGNFDEAVRTAEEARVRFAATGTSDSDWDGRLWVTLSHALRLSGDLEGAEDAIDRAVRALESAHGEVHPAVASAIHAAAILRARRHHDEEAEVLFRRALAIREDLVEPDHPDIGLSKIALANCLSGRPDGLNEALEFGLSALDILQGRLGEDHDSVGNAHGTLGILYKDLDRLDDSVAHLKKAIAIFDRVHGPDHPSLSTPLNNLGISLRLMGRLQEAAVAYTRSKEIKEKAYPPGHPRLITINHNLGHLYLHLHDTEKAWPLLRTALEIKTAVLGPDHPRLASTILYMGTAKAMQGDAEASLELLRRCLDLGAEPEDILETELLGALRTDPRLEALIAEYR